MIDLLQILPPELQILHNTGVYGYSKTAILLFVIKASLPLLCAGSGLWLFFLEKED